MIAGRKIFFGKGGKTVKDTVKGGGGKHTDYFPSDDEIDAAAQDYEAIKAQCLASGVLFEDSEFPATDSSVFFSRSSRRDIYWKRPHEIASDPQFFVDGASR